MRIFRPATKMLPSAPPPMLPAASPLPVKPVQIPRFLLPLLALVVIVALPIAAAVNVEALHGLGEKLYGSSLAWTLPAVVVGYEFVSTGVYFMTPKLLPGLRASALVGAIFGFVGTVALSILYTALYGDGNVGLKILMKPIPSLIAIAFSHMLVLVWHAKLEAAEVNTSLEAASTLPPNDPPNKEEAPTQADLEAAIAAAVDAALAPVVAELEAAKAALAEEARKREAARKQAEARRRQREEAARKQEAEAPELPIEPVLPEAVDEKPETPERPEREARLKSLPRVADSHKRRALEVLEEAAAAGRDPHKVLPSQAKDRFPEGVSNKIVGNAVIVAKHLWAQGVRAADFQEALAV